MAHRLLVREGHRLNHKRTRRLWREEGLRRPPQCRKRRRGPGGELRRASRPNEVWAADFQFDETADGRRLKLLNIVDEFTREALAMRVGRTCDADDVVATIEALVAERGAPAHLRMDNGPELVAWALRGLVPSGGTRDRLHRARLPMADALRGMGGGIRRRPVPVRSAYVDGERREIHAPTRTPAKTRAAAPPAQRTTLSAHDRLPGLGVDVTDVPAGPPGSRGLGEADATWNAAVPVLPMPPPGSREITTTL